MGWGWGVVGGGEDGGGVGGWEVGTDGRTLSFGGGGGVGKAYLKGGSFQSSGPALEPRFRPAASVPRPVRTWKGQDLPCRAVQRPSVPLSERGESRAQAGQPEPGYLWVSAGRGAAGRGPCLT